MVRSPSASGPDIRGDFATKTFPVLMLTTLLLFAPAFFRTHAVTGCVYTALLEFTTLNSFEK
jgi:hypothetical protein